ncbi:proprotein_convertase subtilisin/kexin type 5-like [Hexamita inflata]|uniref:Proprotein convertase subtilisin/kexin type 5-like n=1 Tax=Hexamita inflata TaxID=28002 RepID=A0AA86RBW3_9EUKA|nr:proprotein convertase subtilisin/kexin type 5-like [Hexamita inflata]
MQIIVLSLLTDIEYEQQILDTRVWLGDVPVYLNIPFYDFSQKVSADVSVNADASVVNVLGLYLYSKHKGFCQYNVINLAPGASIKNAFFYFNVDLTVPAGCTNVQVAFANSVAGSFTNVSLAGKINLKDAGQVTKYDLSKFVGRVYSAFAATSCQSSLQFTVNSSAASGSPKATVYETSFDNAAIALVQSTEPALSDATVKLCAASIAIKTTSAAASHPGLVQEWYEQRLNLWKWKTMQTQNYYADFDAAGKPTVDVAKSVQRAYYDGSSVVVFSASQTIQCSKFYDPAAKSCMSDCNAKQFGLFCLDSCAGLLDQAGSKMCFTSCPVSEGYYQAGSTCTLCAGLSVDGFSCASSCPASSDVQVTKGCLARAILKNDPVVPGTCATACAPGKLLDSACGDACSDGKITQSALRACVGCSSDYNGGSFWVRSPSSCAKSCTHYNGTYCEALGSSNCEVFYVEGGKNKCAHTCPGGFSYLSVSEKRCYASCPQMTDDVAKTCVDNCTSGFYYVDSATKFCLGSCGGTNFTALEADKHASNLRCESSCALFDAKPYSNQGVCVPACSGPRKFISTDNKTCTDTCAFYNITGGKFFCMSTCGGFSGNDSTQSLTVSRCEASCSSFDSAKFIDQTNKICLPQCSGSIAFYIPGNICVSSCSTQTDYKFINQGSNQCVNSCASKTYSKPGELTCMASACPSSSFSGIDSFHATYTRCESSCKLFDLNKFSDGKACVFSCPAAAKYFDPDNKCLAVCPDLTPYAEGSNACAAKCSSGFYEVAATAQTLMCKSGCGTGQFFLKNATSDSKQCVASCRALSAKRFVDTLGKECVDCPTFYSPSGSELKCQDSCSDFSGIDKKHDDAVLRCDTSCSDFADPIFVFGKTCVSKCPASDPFFITDTLKTCVSSCSSQAKKLLNVATGECIDSCVSGDALSKDGTKCVSDCKAQDSPNILNAAGSQCVSDCVSDASYLNLKQTRCVSDCKADDKDSAANPATHACDLSCSSGFMNLAKTGCVASCKEEKAVVNLDGTMCEVQCSSGVLNVAKTKCDASCAGLGSVLQDKACVCDQTSGFSLYGDACGCALDRGFKQPDVSGVCECDIQRHFSQVVADSSPLQCGCAQKYSLAQNSCVKQMKTTIIIAASASALFLVLLITFVILYKKCHSKKEKRKVTHPLHELQQNESDFVVMNDKLLQAVDKNQFQIVHTVYKSRSKNEKRKTQKKDNENIIQVADSWVTSSYFIENTSRAEKVE